MSRFIRDRELRAIVKPDRQLVSSLLDGLDEQRDEPFKLREGCVSSYTARLDAPRIVDPKRPFLSVRRRSAERHEEPCLPTADRKHIPADEISDMVRGGHAANRKRVGSGDIPEHWPMPPALAQA